LQSSTTDIDLSGNLKRHKLGPAMEQQSTSNHSPTAISEMYATYAAKYYETLKLELAKQQSTGLTKADAAAALLELHGNNLSPQATTMMPVLKPTPQRSSNVAHGADEHASFNYKKQILHQFHDEQQQHKMTFDKQPAIHHVSASNMHLLLAKHVPSADGRNAVGEYVLTMERQYGQCVDVLLKQNQSLQQELHLLRTLTSQMQTGGKSTGLSLLPMSLA
jgi:hypothetical protein